MEKTLEIINQLLVVFFDLLIYTRLFSIRKKNMTYRMIMYGGCLVIITAYFAAVKIFHMPEAMSSAIFMSVPSFILFFCLSKHRDSRFILTFCFVDTISLIIAFLGRYAGILFHGGNLIATIVTLILFLAVVIVGNPYFKKYHELLEVAKAGWRSMAFASVFIYFALVFFAAYPKPMLERTEYGPAWLVFAGVVLSCYVVFVFSIIKTRKIYEQNKRLEKEKEIYQMAFTDALTGVYNRTFYQEKIGDFQRRKQDLESLCFVVIDINKFKAINDTKGHYVGDCILADLGETLKKIFNSPNESVFRLGGDEFCVLAEGVSEDYINYYVHKLHREILMKGKKRNVEFSVAVGYDFVRLGEDEEIEKAFIRADRKMYQHKNRTAV